jgi:hypothetical protein
MMVLGGGLPIVVNDDGTEDAHRTNGVSPSNHLCHWLHETWRDARQVKRDHGCGGAHVVVVLVIKLMMINS